MSCVLVWGTHREGDPAWMQCLMLCFALISGYGWPHRITFDNMGLTQRSLFGIKRTILYRDVQYIVPVAVQFLLYASPIAYSASAVPVHLRSIFAFNPLVGLMEAFRWVSLGTPVANWDAVIYSAVASILVFCLGHDRRLEHIPSRQPVTSQP